MPSLAIIVVLFLLAVHVVLAVRFRRLGAASSVLTALGLWLWLGPGGNLPATVAASLSLPFVTGLTIFLSRPGAHGPRWLRAVFVWFVPIAGLLLTAGLSGSAFGYLKAFGGLFLVVWVAAGIHALLVSRRTFTENVVSVLAAVVRQNLPLPAALSAAAGERRDKTARVLRTVASYMAEGAPLGYALRMGFRACPGRVLGLIAAAERVGQLAPALECINKDMAKRRADRASPKPMHPAYVVFVVFVALVILSLLGVFAFTMGRMVNLMARLEGVPQARLTGVVLDIVLPVARVLAPPLIAAGLVAAGVAVYAALRPRRPGRPRWLSVLGDHVKWSLPVVRWFERNNCLLQLIEQLRLALLAGTTVDDAIASALDLDLNVCFRRRLRRWLKAVRRGEDPSASARACGLGEPLAWAFDTQVNPGRTPEALEFLEAFYRGNYSYKARLAYYAVWPGVTLALAALVGTVFAALILALVNVTASVAASALP